MEHLELNVFPIGTTKHIAFCIAATLFFLLQFTRTKRWYQLILAVAIPLSLLVYVNPDNETFFYGIGILEACLLLLALILNIVQSRQIAAAEKAAKEAEAAAEAAKPAVMEDAPYPPVPEHTEGTEE